MNLKFLIFSVIIGFSFSLSATHQYATAHLTGRSINDSCVVEVQVDIHKVLASGTDLISTTGRKWMAAGGDPNACEGALNGFDNDDLQTLYDTDPAMAAKIDFAIQEALANGTGLAKNAVEVEAAEQILEGVSVFPNPSSVGYVELKFNEEQDEEALFAIRLHALSGSYTRNYGVRSLEEGVVRIQTIQLPEGLYLLTIRSNQTNKTYQQKITVLKK